ncbi:tRNA nucleotidyltransferase (CCA-adding enzyme) [Allofrancisella inopinata]|uniref:tRNA CCA-pyrophosphorylase n=1 Tax=Allofrancisella inopinata TaxID=1085647 RepID=A0AAE6YH84_9GAMM|nr:tRNA CCA-pyrophosphorylase [Allofrancisella inopinata]QIV95516.1 tRNA CCA-pyrophosphorylase [Allofrancisella inopinata]TDT72654.1 tRNA nucleotidyltransferase (CCA-adding enzyme) [Allofrancisella inopinata]
MKTYLVGGAVRDMLLGLIPKDKDWVVVGATPEKMQQLGFKKVVSSFPVFIHPITKQEYALARTERKISKGYHGFKPEFSVTTTLEEDLKRRDLTINSIALDENNNIIDPFNGQQDIKNKILRHTSEAFCEDPLRVVRLARLKTQLCEFNFQIADETKKVVNNILESDELLHIAKARLYMEFVKSLKNPRVFFESLNELKSLEILFPSIHKQLSLIPSGNFFYHNLYRLATTDIKIALTFFNIDQNLLHSIRKELFLTNNQYKLIVAVNNIHTILKSKEKNDPKKILSLLKNANLLRDKCLFSKTMKAYLRLTKILHRDENIYKPITKLKLLKKLVSDINKSDIKCLVNSTPTNLLRARVYQLHLDIVKNYIFYDTII